MLNTDDMRIKLYGLLGLVFIAISFLHWFLPYVNEIILPAHMLFYAGNILFFDALSAYFGHFSLLHSEKSYIRLGLHLVIAGLIFGFLAEVYVHWIGRFWYYPTLTHPWLYFIGIGAEFAIYTLYLLETYLGVKALLEHFFHHRIHRKESFAGFKQLYIVFGLTGATLLGAATVLVLFEMGASVSPQNIFLIIDKPFHTNISYFVMVGIAICFWMILEFLEYEKHETSMLYETVKGNYFPVIAVFVSAWISAFIYEGFNVPSGAWRYANFPFANLALWGVPLFVFLTWPFHYFPLFSLYRVLFKKESEKLWQ